jgi:hypothetical protein
VISWSTADRPNPAVSEKTLKMVAEVADAAGHDLTLSSGLRPGDVGNHGRGTAVDVSAIDGVDIGQGDVTNPKAMGLAADVQRAANAHPDVREDFGPTGLWKAQSTGAAKSNYNDGSVKRQQLQQAHKDHIHLSSQP